MGLDFVGLASMLKCVFVDGWHQYGSWSDNNVATRVTHSKQSDGNIANRVF